MHIFLFQTLSALALFLIFFKVFFGVILLITMKKNLNFYYLIKKREIIATVVISCVITLWKGIYNFFTFLRNHDLKFSFLHRQEMDGHEIPLEIFIFFVDTMLPLVAIFINIRTVNFKKYLKNLIKACGINQHYAH